MSSTAPTNRNVTVTASFAKDVAKKQYSSDNKNWNTYSKALSVGTNGTYYFRGVDAAGNVSKVASVKVSNIDKVAPNAPTVKVSSTKVTNKSVTVTASFAKDVSKKQYSTDNKNWNTYSKALTVKANGTYYFRGVDAAGNISKVASVKVGNIVDTSNNSWANATPLKGAVLAALENSADAVDYYDVGDVAKLMLDMEAGKAKVTFCGSDKRAVATKVKCADGSVRSLSSLTLASGDKVNDNITLADLGGTVKYLKLESATNGMSNCRLAKLA